MQFFGAAFLVFTSSKCGLKAFDNDRKCQQKRQETQSSQAFSSEWAYLRRPNASFAPIASSYKPFLGFVSSQHTAHSSQFKKVYAN